MSGLGRALQRYNDEERKILLEKVARLTRERDTLRAEVEAWRYSLENGFVVHVYPTAPPAQMIEHQMKETDALGILKEGGGACSA